MKQAVRHALFKEELLGRGDRVVAALSGGADSVALTHCLLSLAREGSFSLSACHLNHGLRGAASDRDEAFVRAFAAKLGLPLFVKAVDCQALMREKKISEELAARQARYAFFDEAMQALGANRVATAHTADDQLETLLFHLARGSGLRGLCGIPPKRGAFIRPMLAVTREMVMAYLHDHALSHCIDETNENPAYTRNFIRLAVVPQLLRIHEGAAKHAAAAAASMRADLDFIEQSAKEAFASIASQGEGRAGVDRAALLALSAALRPRVLSLMAAAAEPGARLTQKKLSQLLHILEDPHPSKRLDLGFGLTARRENEKLWIEAGAPDEAPPPVPFPSDGNEAVFGAFRVRLHEEEGEGLLPIDRETLCLRSAETGDTIRLRRGGGKKRVLRLFIDRKIPRHKRPHLPVLADQSGVVAVCGLGENKERAGASGGAFRVAFEEIEGGES